MIVNYHRPKRPGPELILEEMVVSRLKDFLDSDKAWWLAGSLPLGAGVPDLVAAHYKTTLERLGPLTWETVEILAYLRSVGRARPDTVASRLQLSIATTKASIATLSEAGALVQEAGPLSLTQEWRTVLPEVIAIEVKVSDWRRALSQATRNLIFAHRSFVALPLELAHRIRRRTEFGRFGIGIIAVAEDDHISIARRARRTNPRSWRYYYRLAALIASETKA